MPAAASIDRPITSPAAGPAAATEDQAVRRRIVDGDRGRLCIERERGRLDDRAKPGVGRGRIEPVGGGDPAGERAQGEHCGFGGALARVRGPGRVRGRIAVGHRRAASASRAASGMTRVVAVEAQQTLFDEVREQPVHRLARATDHAGQLGLGVRPRQAVLAGRRSGVVGPVDLGRPVLDRTQQVAGQPARQVEEVEVLDLGGQPADLGRERRQQRPAELRLLVDQAIERIPAQHARLDTVQRDRRGRARRTVEQRQLAEEPARPDRGQDRRLGAVVRGKGDLHEAGGDDEQGVARVAAVEDDLAAAESTRAQGRPRRGRWTRRRGRRRDGRPAVPPERR